MADYGPVPIPPAGTRSLPYGSALKESRWPVCHLPRRQSPYEVSPPGVQMPAPSELGAAAPIGSADLQERAYPPSGLDRSSPAANSMR